MGRVSLGVEKQTASPPKRAVTTYPTRPDLPEKTARPSEQRTHIVAEGA